MTQRVRCRNGHSYAEVGRHNDGRCAACANACARRHRLRKKAEMELWTWRVLPAQPLAVHLRVFAKEIAAANGGLNYGYSALSRMYAERYGCKPQHVYRRMIDLLTGKQAGIWEFTADQWCTLIGLHLDVVWPDKDVAA